MCLFYLGFNSDAPHKTGWRWRKPDREKMRRRQYKKNKVMPPRPSVVLSPKPPGLGTATIIIGLVTIVTVSTMVSLVVFNRIWPSSYKASSQPDGSSIQWDRLQGCQIIPEYKRSLKKVVISLDTVKPTLKLQHNILSHLCEYTEIILLLPQCNLESVVNQLKDKPYYNRIRLVAFEERKRKDCSFFLVFPDKDKLVHVYTGNHLSPKQPGSVWAQDLFEVMKKPDGRILLVTSEVHKYYSSVGEKTDTKVLPDNMYLNNLSTVADEVVKIPLVFQGGNIFVDEIDGQKVVFCGGDILNETRTVWHGIAEKKLSDSEIIRLITDIFNAEKVVIVAVATKDRLQPSLMYHLDQAMILLADGIAGVARIVGQDAVDTANDDEVRDVERFLSKLRTILLDLGYKVINIDITVDNLLRCQHYVNAIPYIDAETDQKTILMPVFSEQTDFDKELVRRNTASFEALGYKVISVPTKADKLKGGIHCLINVLE